MHLKRVTYASVVAIGVGVCALTAGGAVANAQGPQCPPQAGDCQGGPQGPGGPHQGGPQGPPPQQGGPQGLGNGPGNGPGDGRDYGPGNGPGDGRDYGPGNGPGDWHNGPGGPPDWRGPDYHGGPGGPEWGPPPPDQAWRSIDDGRRDHQPFNYNNNWVEPIYSPVFNNWGFWFFGAWIPL